MFMFVLSSLPEFQLDNYNTLTIIRVLTILYQLTYVRYITRILYSVYCTSVLYEVRCTVHKHF